MKNTRPLLASMTCTFVTQDIYLSDLDEVTPFISYFHATATLDPLIADPPNETPPLHTHPVTGGTTNSIGGHKSCF